MKPGVFNICKKQILHGQLLFCFYHAYFFGYRTLEFQFDFSGVALLYIKFLGNFNYGIRTR